MSAELIKSKFVGRPSVNLWHRLSMNLMRGFLSNLAVASPGPYPRTFFNLGGGGIFCLFVCLFCEYFSFSLTWVLMGAKISKRYSSYKSPPKIFKLCPNFLPNSPHKTTFGAF